MITNKDEDSSIVTMNAVGGNKRVVYKAVDGVAFSHWEDAMPRFVPKVERVAASQTEPEKKFGWR